MGRNWFAALTMALSVAPCGAETKAPRPLPAPVALPALTASGIAVDVGRAVWLLNTTGTVLAKLRGYDVAGNPGAPGVWLREGRQFFRLRAGAGVLAPVSRWRAGESAYDEEPPRLHAPPGAWTKGIGISGHWRYAYERPGALLAQWSDECEVPFAFWKEPGSPPIVVTGERDYWKAPESVALGWTPEGRAIVALGAGLCGEAGDPPGIYAFDAPGEGVLLFETRGMPAADMW